MAFVDGRNLTHGVKEAFGYAVPDFDLIQLCNAIAEQEGWHLRTIPFHTGFFGTWELRFCRISAIFYNNATGDFITKNSSEYGLVS